MSDDKRSEESLPKRAKPHKETVEIYRDLVHIEVRGLVTRVTELTKTIGNVFTEVTALALQLEESTGTVDQLASSLDYCRSELKELKERVAEHTQRLDNVQNGGD